MSKKPETLFRRKVLCDLRSVQGIVPFTIQQLAINGTPDILMCAWGWFVAIELKATFKSRVSALQKYNLSVVEKAHGLAYVVHPGNWEIIFDEIKKLKEHYI